MKKSKNSRRTRLRLEELEPRLVLSAPLGNVQNFDTTAPSALPVGWSQWSSTGTNDFAVSSVQSVSAPNSLAVNSSVSSRLNGRAWVSAAQSADEEVSASVYLNSLIPVAVFDRGANLNSTAPSYYGVSVTRGLDLQLVKVNNGTVTTLGEVKSTNWISDQWVSVTLLTSGNDIRAQVQNAKGQYLNSSGQWQNSDTWALNATDSSLSSGGEAGVGGSSVYTGTVYVDNFAYGSMTISTQPPTVTIKTPASGATVSGVMPVQATATDSVGVTSVEFYIDNVLRQVASAAPYTWNFDTTEIANGAHTLTIVAYDADQNVGQASLTFTSQNNLSPLPKPSIPQSPTSAQLMDLLYYNGASQLPAADAALLQDGAVDMVVSDPRYFSQINALVPNVPQLIYTNVSTLYQSSLLSWLNYAEANGISPEQAFYHVSQATPYTGGGGATQPVDWFWGVYTGGTSLADRTWWAHAGGGAGINFGTAGQSVYIGYLDPFWEANFALISGASGGWAGVLQYPTAVDAKGNPTSWATLSTLSDTTGGFSQSGQITFNPPSNWVPASIDGSAPMYYVRVLTTTSGKAPVANTILGEDYTNSHGASSGVIPAYDWALDPSGGYLDPQQYALAAAAGYTARFGYQSRLFTYGPMRFVTNPGDAAFRTWAAGYEIQYLDSNPLAAGLFIDNSNGNPPQPSSVVEPVGSYPTDYATLLYQIGRAIEPKWIMANTSGGGSNANPTAQMVQGYFEEFGLRPLGQNFQQFENLSALVAQRAALSSPSPIAVLDTYPQNGSPTDPRMELAALASYYLLAGPNTYMDYDGGYDPSGSWSKHWFPAMNVNIGQATGSWSLFASGADPSNPSLTYQIYQRSFTNALVMYKPLSSGKGATGVTADDTATTEALNGTYYPLQANGTLGSPISSITLRNGEGAILIKESAVASSFVVKTSTSSTTAGTAEQVTVEAVDASGQVVPSYTGTVHFTSTDGAAVLPADYTFTAADNGVYTFNVTFKTAGSQTLTVTDPFSGITGTLPAITVMPAAASQLLVTAPGSVTVLTPLRITVTALDPYGNQVTDYTGTIHFASSDALAWLPTNYTFTAADEGQHVFSSGLMMWQTGDQSITVTDTKTAIVGSTMIQVKKSSSGSGTDWISGS